MKKNQFETPLVDAILKYILSGPARFHVPGHGGGKAAPGELLSLAGRDVFLMDVTELPGLDDLNGPAGVIASAQELAAGAFGADRSFFLANGTTGGLQALILASGRPGDRLILPRNCHRSIIGGLVLSGMDPVFITPSIVPDFNFAAGVPVSSVERAVTENPGARAVLCVHPTYYGTAGNTCEAARLAHAAGMPLLADEAHGSHLYFHPDLPEGALESGADASVQSLHKTGGSMTQSSVLHLKGTLLDPCRVFSAVKMIQTSSPSYILMASLDAARKQLATRGHEILGEVLEAALELRERLSGIGGIEVLGPRNLDGDAVFAFDPCRVVIRVSGLGLTGYQASGWLARNHGIYVEMADRDNLVVVLGLGASREDCRKLARAVGDFAKREGKGRNLSPIPGMPEPRMVMNPRDAWFAPSRRVKLDRSSGLVCGEWVAVYPPGIPALLPGEEITRETLNYLTSARDAGACFQGPDDPGLEYLNVIDG
ncbi:MAG: aminotransferase class I/II-fold pyridoxal phosphate-dependent enzyme [Bacillota bacterium]